VSDKIPPGFRQGLITAITVFVTASLLYFRFVAFEPTSGPWTTLGVVCASLAGISICVQLFTLWRALQPDDEQVLVYKVTLRWFAAAVLLLVGSFVAYIVASLVYVEADETPSGAALAPGASRVFLESPHFAGR
jgi:hypothetical protein